MAVVFDRDAALALLEGDAAALRQLAQMFLELAPPLLADVRAALDARDAAALTRASHRFKSGVSGFMALPTSQAALRLEVLGRQGDLTRAEEAWLDLRREFALLAPELTAFCEEAPLGGDRS